MLNIFVTPGEVFEEIKGAKPEPTNWLVPAFIYSLVAAMATVLITSQPAIAQQGRERQAKALEEAVKSGKMTREQADQQLDVVEKMSGWIMKIGGAFVGIMTSFIEILGWGFIMWLIARIGFKQQLDFMKLVEVAGLASGIAILEALVRMLLIIITANPLASLSPALWVNKPFEHGTLTALLAMVNPLLFWLLAVRSIGLAKILGVPTVKAAAWVVSVWLALMLGFVGFGLAAELALKKIMPQPQAMIDSHFPETKFPQYCLIEMKRNHG